MKSENVNYPFSDINARLSKYVNIDYTLYQKNIKYKYVLCVTRTYLI